MRFSETVGLPGSSPVRCDGSRHGRIDPDLPLAVTVHLRARPDSAGLGWVNRQATLPPSRRTVLTREQLGEWHGAAGLDVASVSAFAAARGLRVVAEHPARRRVLLAGSAAAMERAFETSLVWHERSGVLHVGREAPVHLPPEVCGAVRAVLGLDACLQPLECVDDVALPAGVAVVPAAPTECGVVDALIDCVHDTERRPLVVLLGFGAPETEWSGYAMLVVEQTLLAAAAMGVTVLAASPAGAAWFPATAPHAVACGSGDGRSGVFPEPSWQDGEGLANGAGEPASQRGGPAGVWRRVPDMRLAAEVAAAAVAAAVQRIGYPLGCVNAALWRSGFSGAVLPDLDALVAAIEGVSEATPA